MNPTMRFLRASSCLQVKQDPCYGCCVSGAIEIPLINEKDIQEVLEEGLVNRAVASTQMNAESSRSHCIIYIMVEKELEDGSLSYGKLCIVDLAGSERQTKTGTNGVTLEEGTRIAL